MITWEFQSKLSKLIERVFKECEVGNYTHLYKFDYFLDNCNLLYKNIILLRQENPCDQSLEQAEEVLLVCLQELVFTNMSIKRPKVA